MASLRNGAQHLIMAWHLLALWPDFPLASIQGRHFLERRFYSRKYGIWFCITTNMHATPIECMSSFAHMYMYNELPKWLCLVPSCFIVIFYTITCLYFSIMCYILHFVHNIHSSLTISITISVIVSTYYGNGF